VRLAALKQGQTGRPKIIPVRLVYLGPLEYELEIYLGGLKHIICKPEADSRQALTAIENYVASNESSDLVAADALPQSRDEPATKPEPNNRRPQAGRDPRTAMLPGLPIRHDDPFYIEREQDKVVLDLAEMRNRPW